MEKDTVSSTSISAGSQPRMCNATTDHTSAAKLFSNPPSQLEAPPAAWRTV